MSASSQILVLYRVVNLETDNSDPLFNAFTMPKSATVSLASVKQYVGSVVGTLLLSSLDWERLHPFSILHQTLQSSSCTQPFGS